MNNTQISEEERDILQEIMNIAFGQAAAELAEIINIFVVLSVPFIRMIEAVDLPDYIRTEFSEFGNISIVEQNFWGDFKGTALLIFPAGSGKELISLLDDTPPPVAGSQSSDILEKETLMEVGNILIGACVGKVAELLKDVVTYSPPRVIVEDHPDIMMPKTLFDPTNSAIILKTVFCFNERDVHGFLFLITSHKSVAWLKTALADFMKQYE